MTNSDVRRFLLKLPFFQSLCRFLTRNQVRVLMYHRFSADGDKNGAVTRTVLERQMDHLRKYHSIISADDHIKTFYEKRKTKNSKVVVTIDDGYRDYLDVAYPVFNKYEISTTVFVATDFIDGTMWFWWDKLRYLLARVGQNSKDVPLNLPNNEITHFDIGGKDTWDSISSLLVRLDPNEITSVLDKLSATLKISIPKNAPEEYQSLTWSDIQSIHCPDCQFGAHTASHPVLSTIPLAKAEEEIKVSLDRLQSQLGNISNVFCYPQGRPADYNDSIKKILQRWGFAGAYSAHYKQNDNCHFSARRFNVGNDLNDFYWKLCGAHFLSDKLRSSKATIANVIGVF